NDFIVSDPYNWTDGIARVYLFWGGDSISFARSTVFSDSVLGFFGTSVANIVDINGDGFDDLAIGADNENKVYYYYCGNPMIVNPGMVVSLNAQEIGMAGYLNRSGIEDYFISDGLIYFFSGKSLLFTINWFDLGGSGYVNVQSNCDLNNDGYSDYIIGNTDYINSDSVMVGGAFVYFGGKIIDTVYRFKLEGEHKWDEFSKIMTTVDINGDGYDELFIMAPGYPDYNNPLGKVYIYSCKKNLSDVKVNKQTSPYNFDLYQNYPDPFDPSTVISYQIASAGKVSLKVYDLLGREVATLVNGVRAAGNYTTTFNAVNLPSGVYFYRLQAGIFMQTKIMLVLK
ncbi:MAG: T9SS type A sorting domain-containing protein, partial [Bacteroidota bacterium]